MTVEHPDFFSLPEPAEPVTIPPTFEAALLAGRITRGELSATAAIGLVAEHLLRTVPEADVCLAALTLVAPIPAHGWSRLGERAWVREWVRPGSAYAEGPRVAESPVALTMPWISQQARRYGLAMADREHPLPEDATADRREAAAYGIEATLSASLIGDEVMMGSLALAAAAPIAWSATAVADVALLKSALTARLTSERAGAALTAAVSRGDQARESQEHFFAVVGHDLRGPLADLVERAHSLQHGEARDAREAAGALAGAAEHALAVVDDLLAARRELVRSDLEWVDLGEAVADVVHWMRSAADEADVVLSAEGHPGLEVWTTGTALRQVLVSLVGNAVSRTPAGGAVQMVAEQVRSDDTDPGVRVTVRDEGPALSLEEQEQLFRPALRGSSASVPGAQLGLTMSRALAERDGGVVAISSEPGHGSATWVELRGRQRD